MAAPKSPSVKEALVALCEAAGLDLKEVTAVRFYAEHKRVEFTTNAGVHRAELG